MSKSFNVLFFSRGRGHGHAIPDMAIAAEMATIAPFVEIQFVSYATGARTLSVAKRQVLDLQLPEDNKFLETLGKAKKLIDDVNPDVVVAHEEFAAIAASSLVGRPSIYLSAWLPPQGSLGSEALSYADAIIVLEEPGIFASPIPLRTAPRFSGRVYRKMKFSLDDRQRIRENFKIPEGAFVVLVSPGGSATEERFPILDIVLSAYTRLRHSHKALFWVTAKDSALVQRSSAMLPNVHVFNFYDPIEELIAMSDVVITKGTRGATLDAATVGVPSISLSYGANPIDDLLVPRILSNTSLNARATDGAVLAYYLDNVSDRWSAPKRGCANLPSQGGATKVANMLVEELSRLCPATFLNARSPCS